VENAILQTLGAIHGPQNRQFILVRNDRNGACRYAPFLDQPSMLAHYTEPSSHWWCWGQSDSISFHHFPIVFFSWSNPIPIMGYIHLYPIIIFPYYVIYINIPCIMFYIPHDVPIHRMSQARMWNAPSSNMSSAVSRCPVVLAQWCPVVGMDGYPNPVTESDIWMVYIYICVWNIF
jgi:hypothetical protein